MTELNQIVEQLSQLTVMEAADLAKKLEDVWGVSASAPAVVVTEPQGDDKVNKAEEQSEFDVILDSAGDKRISVIKEIKSITGLGLKEAKELVVSAPQPIKTAISRSDAEELKNKLEAVGAKISLK